MLTVLFVVVSFQGFLLPWRNLAAGANVQELLKVKEELSAAFHKLNVALEREEENAAKDLLKDESLKVFSK